MRCGKPNVGAVTELYWIAPCPKCKADTWLRRGGHHGIKEYWVCAICGLDTNRLREVLRIVDAAEERSNHDDT